MIYLVELTPEDAAPATVDGSALAPEANPKIYRRALVRLWRAIVTIHRKKPAQRKFHGLVGLPSEPDAPKPGHETLADASQRLDAEQAHERAVRELLEGVKYEGWVAGDDDPIVSSQRPRSNGFQGFQRYQFRTSVTGAKNKRFDRGINPAIYGNMANSIQERQSGLDSNGENTQQLFSGGQRDTTFSNVMQSMPKGCRVGVPTQKFDYIETPRTPTAETAWIFSEPRFKYFIVSQISAGAIQAAEENPDDPLLIGKFARALKSYIALYQHFKIGASDKGFLEDDARSHLHLWPTTNALKRDRGRMVQLGHEMFGTPKNPKDLPDDKTRVEKVWQVFRRVFCSLPYVVELVA